MNECTKVSFNGKTTCRASAWLVFVQQSLFVLPVYANISPWPLGQNSDPLSKNTFSKNPPLIEEPFEGVVRKCVCLNSAAVAMVLRPKPAYVQIRCKLNGMSSECLICTL